MGGVCYQSHVFGADLSSRARVCETIDYSFQKGRLRMFAMVMDEARRPLRAAEVPVPQPGPGEVLVRVHACGVCRTDLHVVDGDLDHPKLPLIPGHEIVGTVQAIGAGVEQLVTGQRVGVPWLGYTCGRCDYCRAGRENLCDGARFTGYDLDGGYAEYTVADARYCFPLPEAYSDAHAAPLLCAGLIGYRSLVMAGDARRLGIYGFGAAAHIIAQVAVWQGREVFAFSRPGDEESQRFALDLGATWVGESTDAAPAPLDAALIFAPVGALVPAALRATAKGGTVVCAGIHMSEIPAFPYEILWGERTVRSVANLTRRDGEEFLSLAPKVPVRTEVECLPLSDANDALRRLAGGQVRGAAVLMTDAS
jgi:propanol-preferring alcohol dehydrogenase